MINSFRILKRRVDKWRIIGEGEGRLFRWYEILDTKGNVLFKGGGGEFGANQDQTKLVHVYDCGPLADTPESIVLVLTGEGGDLLMDEAVTVPVIPAE